jgi:hypothetical protein
MGNHWTKCTHVALSLCIQFISLQSMYHIVSSTMPAKKYRTKMRLLVYLKNSLAVQWVLWLLVWLVYSSHLHFSAIILAVLGLEGCSQAKFWCRKSWYKFYIRRFGGILLEGVADRDWGITAAMAMVVLQRQKLFSDLFILELWSLLLHILCLSYTKQLPQTVWREPKENLVVVQISTYASLVLGFLCRRVFTNTHQILTKYSLVTNSYVVTWLL